MALRCFPMCLCREAMHLQCFLYPCAIRDGQGYARTYTWRPLPDLLKIGMWGAHFHCMALQRTLAVLWGFSGQFFSYLVCVVSL
jgi:hypothetical protein